MKSGSKTCRVGTVEVTHKGKRRGRKKMFSPEEFELKASEYFAHCDTKERRPTLAGLFLFLGFASKQSIADYKKDPAYNRAIGRAYMYIEDYVCDAMMDKERYTTGQMFYLKSVFGYEDKQSVDHTSSDGAFGSKEQSLAVLEALKRKHEVD